LSFQKNEGKTWIEGKIESRKECQRLLQEAVNERVLGRKRKSVGVIYGNVSGG
jgi:hypothetical protein